MTSTPPRLPDSEDDPAAAAAAPRGLRALRGIRALPARGMIFCIELYRSYVSPMRMPTCRFTPTCSEYAVESLRTHGLWKGTTLATIRLVKCAPWHSGGWDPVPEAGRFGVVYGMHRVRSMLPSIHVKDPSPLSLDKQRST